MTGSHLDFGARIYDSRLGRWLACDPQTRRQPSWSPYKAFLDNPILFVDPDGETEWRTVTTHNLRTGKTTQFLVKYNNVATDGKIHDVRKVWSDVRIQSYFNYSSSQTIIDDGNGNLTAYKPKVNKLGSRKGWVFVWWDGDEEHNVKEEGGFNWIPASPKQGKSPEKKGGGGLGNGPADPRGSNGWEGEKVDDPKNDSTKVDSTKTYDINYRDSLGKQPDGRTRWVYDFETCKAKDTSKVKKENNEKQGRQVTSVQENSN